jgi:hypothetical protein
MYVGYASGAEEMTVTADLWVFTAAAPGTAAARGVPLPGGAAWHVPRAGVDPTSGLEAAPTTTTSAPPTGVAVRVTGGTWTLTGTPVSAVRALEGRAAGASALHTVTLPAAGVTLTVPPGTLRPGYV